MSKKNLVTFLDGAQRTIIGEQASAKTDTQLLIKNPVVVNIVPQHDPISGQPTGQLALQLLPVFFKEFLADKEEDVEYSFSLDSITEIEFDGGFDERLHDQYEGTLNPKPQVAAAPTTKPGESTAKVVDIFADKDK